MRIKTMRIKRRVEILEESVKCLRNEIWDEIILLNKKIKQLECPHLNLKVEYNFNNYKPFIVCSDCNKEMKYISEKAYEKIKSKCSNELQKVINPPAKKG